MAVKLSTFGAAIVADATGLATELGGGATAAEFQALGRFLIAISTRNDLAVPALKLAYAGDVNALLLG